MFLIFRQIQKAPPQSIRLTPEELSHSGARRLQVGAVIHLGDGSSRRWSGYLREDRKSVEILPRVTEKREPLRILCSAAPKGARLDWMIEKAVELGATHLQLMLYQHSIRRKINRERLMRLVRNAAAQSQRFFLPQVLMPIPVTELPHLLTSLAKERGALKAKEEKIDKKIGKKIEEKIKRQKSQIGQVTQRVFVLHPQWMPKEIGLGISSSLSPVEGAALIVGPEAGFSRDELSFFQTEGYSFMQVSQNILRIETAALAALALLQGTVH